MEGHGGNCIKEWLFALNRRNSLVIGSSTIGMESVRRYSSVSMEAGNMTTWNGLGQVTKTASGSNNVEAENEKTTTGNSSNLFEDSMKNLMERFSQVKASRGVDEKQERDAMMKIKAQCINYLIQILFGRKSTDPAKLVEENTKDSTGTDNQDMLTNLAGWGQSQQAVGGQYFSMQYYSETEQTSFQTNGTVVTADGREINFGLSFEMSRSFTSYYEEKYEFGTQFIDPLVINLDSNVASVSDQKFMFDIDSDGVLDRISEPSDGTGFLALDLNGDSTINDGSELFGTKSGDGFSDLAAYDSDGNGWIDEADEIWSKLLIWSKEPNGKDSLYGLGEKGVGAIYLGNVSTDYSLNSPWDNTTNAAIRKTGVFLYENGNAGTVQHLDLAR